MADGRLVVDGPRGPVVLSLRPHVQQRIEGLLRRLDLPYAAVVIVEPATGAVRVWAEHRRPGDPAGLTGGLSRADTPAASVFKVIAAASLLEAGVSPQERTCFRGGHGEIGLGHLQDRAGEPCESLSTSLARSNNTTFARLADRRLTSGALAATANRFLFGQALPFELGAEPSRIDEGASRLDRARTAAGLQGSTLSPLHGALIAAAIGNGGVLMRPWIAESWEGGGPRTPEVLTTALTPGQAADLAGMMAETVPYGTGRRAFARRAPALATVTVAAKTGSLSGRDPRVYRHYTWFVGFAPVHRPEVAFAVLAVNGLAWRARAPDIAREALTRWFEGESVPLEIAQAAPSPKARPAIKAKRAGHRKAAVHRRIRHRGDHGSPRSRPARSGRLHGVGAPSA